ncbi:MAG: aminotransferase class I/II-fold pyridoxal phosphate-dependent enzyme [Candidatus Omnitrophica bacterium]|nr:aminotransferase class I/II-fold pyridoxal phosphate-dependent enzyme [Candidatus Omnitrophota bacterium]
MNIPLLDLKAQYQTIKDQIDQVLAKVVESQYFILSPEVAALESEVADYTGVSHSAGVASGTDAIILALKALDIGPGDTVITTPFTFFATAESISMVGAKPVFVDIEPDTYNIDPEKVRGLLENMDESEKRSVKAIIPVHLYGQCADMTSLMDLAEKNRLKVVEDCAQAIGATHTGRKAGSFGDAGCFSFFPSKNLGGFGDGGMVVSSREDIIERVKKLRIHGSREQYVHDEIGYNSRLDSLQAAILRIKLTKLDEWFSGRQRIAAKYDEAFSGLDITIPAVAEGNIHTYHQYTVRVDDRNGLKQYLKDKGIAARVYYPVPLHLQPCYKDLGYSIGSFPVSEKMAEHVLSLPVYPELTDEKVEYIISSVTDFINRKS